MLITVDSNVACVPGKTVRLLPRHVAASAWCSEPCVCADIDVGATARDRVFYDTPIAMCSDTVNMSAVADQTVSFVYIDASVQNRSYSRILSNLPRCQTTVVLLANANLESAPKATYTVVLEKNQCGTGMVARLLALMVNAYRYSKVVLHPDTLLDVARKAPRRSVRTIDRDSAPVRCDLYAFSKRNCTMRSLTDDSRVRVLLAGETDGATAAPPTQKR